MTPTLFDWTGAFRLYGMAEPAAPIRIVPGESCAGLRLCDSLQVTSEAGLSRKSAQETGNGDEWSAAALSHLRWFSQMMQDTPHRVLLFEATGAVLHTETSCGAARQAAPALAAARPVAAAAPLALAGKEIVIVLGSSDGCCPDHDRTALAVPLHERSGRVATALELQVAVADADPELLARLAHLARIVEGEMARRQAERELDSASTMARLASFTAHELASPLSGLRTSLHLLGALHREADPSQPMERCRRLVEQMSNVVQDLRVLGSTERPRRQRVRITPLIKEFVQTLELPEQVRLVIRNHADPDATIYGTAHLLAHALRNLVRNAAEAMPDGGRVGIDAETRAGTVRITVWDEGPGIAADVQDALFDESFTTKAHGSGLGLRLVRTIIERAHGGKVSYAPNLPNGARFRMDLPGVPEAPVSVQCGCGAER
jgi:signal transduction histidine kinase